MEIFKNPIKFTRKEIYTITIWNSNSNDFIPCLLDEIGNDEIKALSYERTKDGKEEIILTNINDINLFIKQVCFLFEIKRNYVVSLTVSANKNLRILYINRFTYPKALVTYSSKKYGDQSVGLDLMEEEFNVFS